MAYYQGVALVVDAGCDLGQAIAQAFISAGCQRILLADMSLEALENTKSRLILGRADIRIIQRSLDRTDDFENMVQTAAECFGEINYCVNCSTVLHSTGVPKPTAEMTAAEFKEGLDGSSRAMWLCNRAEVRQLLKQKANIGSTNNSIVNVIPYGAFGSHPGHVIQAAAGYQRVGITKSIARDHLSSIRVNAVCPSLTKSKEDRDGNADMLAQHMKMTGGLVEVNEVANAAIFLAGELSQGITGAVLPVDRGWSMVHN